MSAIFLKYFKAFLNAVQMQEWNYKFKSLFKCLLYRQHNEIKLTKLGITSTVVKAVNEIKIKIDQNKMVFLSKPGSSPLLCSTQCRSPTWSTARRRRSSTRSSSGWPTASFCPNTFSDLEQVSFRTKRWRTSTSRPFPTSRSWCSRRSFRRRKLARIFWPKRRKTIRRSWSIRRRIRDKCCRSIDSLRSDRLKFGLDQEWSSGNENF